RDERSLLASAGNASDRGTTGHRGVEAGRFYQQGDRRHDERREGPGSLHGGGQTRSPSYHLGGGQVMNELTPAGGGSFLAWAPGRADEHCDAFEDALQAGQKPRIVDFLAGVEEPERSALSRELLSLLALYLGADQRRRWQQGECVVASARRGGVGEVPYL